MQKWICLLLLLYSVSSIKPLLAQPFKYSITHTQLTVDNGLSQAFVYRILQDSYGYLWIGTKKGLNRYDGHQFKVYDQSTSGLQDDHIFYLAEDQKQRLWVMYQKKNNSRKVDIIDLATGSVTPFDSLFKHTPLRDNQLFTLEQTPQGEIWVETTTGTVYELTADDNLQPVFSNKSGFQTHYFPLEEGNFIFFETEKAFKTLYHFDASTEKASVLVDEVAKVVNLYSHDKKLAILAFQNNGVSIYDYQKDSVLSEKDQHWLWKTVKNLPPTEEKDYYDLKAVYDPSRDLYWLTFFDRVWAVNSQGKTVFDLSEELSDFIQLGINTIYLDRNHLLWVGTNSGIVKLEFRAKKFKTYGKDHNPILPIRGMAQIDDNNILFSSELQSYFLNISDGSIQPLTRTVPGYTMYHAIDSTLWLGCYGYELHQIRIDTTGQVAYLFDGKEPEDAFITTYCMFQDSAAKLWLGTSRGLAYVDEATGKVIRWKKSGDYPELAEADIFYQVSSPGGNWLATSVGLFRWQTPDHIIANYNSTQDFPYHLPADDISFIHLDAQFSNILWLGSRSKGLIRMDMTSGDFQHWTRKSGLSDNTIYAIYEDDFGALWLSSNNGIMQFEKSTGHIKSYQVFDGIAHQEFNTSSHLQLGDGRLLFGGLNGITLFDPGDFQPDSQKLYTPPLVLTQYHRFDGNTQQTINETILATSGQPLTMKPADLYVRLDFAILDFASNSEHLYTYQIEGLSPEWQILDEPSLKLYNLPPGNYTIQIKAQDLVDGKTDQYLSFQLQVWSPLYKRSWFIALVVAILGLLIGLEFRLRMKLARQREQQLELEVAKRTKQILADKRTIENQAKRLQELDEMKSRFYANISHELRTPLALILGPVQALLDSPSIDVSDQVHEALRLVKRNSNRLLRHVEEILDLSKLQTNTIELKETPTSLTSFIHRTIKTFEYEANQNQIALRLQKAPEVSLHVLLDANKVGKIINNLLYNALKFTPAGGQILVEIKLLDSYIELSVADNGLGISADDLPHIFDRYFQASGEAAATQAGTGIGLAYSRELALLMGGQLTASSTLGEGSTFTFRLPLKETQAQPEGKREDIKTTTSIAPIKVAIPIPDVSVTAGYHILLVEDNVDLQFFVKQLLEERGYKVSRTQNGKEALTKLQEQPVHLIISDVMMPEMDGFTLLEHLKENHKWRQTPVIMLTARAALQDELRALRIGVHDYIIKPFEPQELLLRVANLLHNNQEKRDFEMALTEQNHSSMATRAPHDLSWQERLEALTLANLNNPKMCVPFLAKQLGTSERQLYREVKRFTGLTPNHYIKTVRLQQARRLLESGAVSSVMEVCQTVGFQKASYFSRIFLEQFGRLPSSYLTRE